MRSRRTPLSGARCLGLLAMFVVIAAPPAVASPATALLTPSQEPEPNRPARPARADSAPAAEPVSPPPTAPTHGPRPERVQSRPIRNSLAHDAPTANLSAVANALELRHRSFTTLIFVPAGLALTRPVDIRVAYISPMNAPQQVQASYVPSTGTRFLYNDVVGDGSKRRMTFDITLIERRPANPPIEYSFYWQADLDPLYDVSTGPLTFKLLSDCDWFDESEIRVLMLLPDGSERYQALDLRAGETGTVSGFVWSRAEASASLGLKQPYVRFRERDVNMSLGPGGPTWYVLDRPPLIPNETHLVRFITDDLEGDCRAEISFTEQHTPRYYYYLTP